MGTVTFLRARFEARLRPEQFSAQCAEGRASNLDDLIAMALDELALVAEGS
jgi:hypothetical protein